MHFSNNNLWIKYQGSQSITNQCNPANVNIATTFDACRVHVIVHNSMLQHILYK